MVAGRLLSRTVLGSRCGPPRGAFHVKRDLIRLSPASFHRHGSSHGKRSRTSLSSCPDASTVLRALFVELRPYLKALLEERATRGLLRGLNAVDGVGPVVRRGGRSLLNFSSNDYLGFAADPALRAELREVQAVGAPASRLIVGHLEAHARVEEALAALVAQPSALLFSSGYAANVGTIPALVGPGDLVVSDALNHASLIDGCRLSRADIAIFRHADPASLDAILRERRDRYARVLVVTDAAFSMDGDFAPLRAIASAARRHEAWLYVDEAHTVGVVGPSGAGLAVAQAVVPDVLVGTLGKAFGVAGAFVAGAPELREWLLNTARSFVYSTAYPAALLPVLLRAVDAVRQGDERRARLARHAEQLREDLRALGFEVPGESAIVPVMLGANERAVKVADRLAQAGVLGLAIRPPTVAPGTARLRLTPMATHTEEQVARVVAAMKECR